MNFDDIYGQERALNILKELIRKELLPPVMLFYGPDGVGKKKTAIAIAKSLNCKNRDPLKIFYCDECDVCIRIKNGIYPDLHLLKKEGDSIKIESVRELINTINQVQFEGRKKVVIIDDAHTLTTQSANALLKTLEEPPSNTHIILITSNPGELPLTLRSRCYPFRFNSISPEALLEILRRIKKIDDHPMLKVVARISDGSLYDAERLLETKALKDRENFLQILLGGDYNILSYALFSEESAGKTELMKKTLHIFRQIVLDMLYYKTGLLDRIRNADLIEKIEKISFRYDKLFLWSLMKELNKFEQMLDWNINLKLHQTLLLIKMLDRRVDEARK